LDQCSLGILFVRNLRGAGVCEMDASFSYVYAVDAVSHALAKMRERYMLMSRKLALLLVGGVLGAMVPFSAHAFPVSAPPTQVESSGVMLIAGGCGIGFHRSVYGYCVRNGYYAPPVPVPAPYYAPPIVRACPYPYRLDAYGRCVPW
jgi:hypothetical protein